jgi:hypothetical protein
MPFCESMLCDINYIKLKFDLLITKAKSLNDVSNVKTKFLGKDGFLNLAVKKNFW